MQNPFVTTPTQPQLNSKVGCDTKMTLDHHHHHKLNVINISAVCGQILTLYVDLWDQQQHEQQ